MMQREVRIFREFVMKLAVVVAVATIVITLVSKMTDLFLSTGALPGQWGLEPGFAAAIVGLLITGGAAAIAMIYPFLIRFVHQYKRKVVDRRFVSNRSIQFIFVVLLVLTTVSSAFAWQTVIPGFHHLSRYGGEAESGNRAGSVEYSGTERFVRAGASHIFFTQAQIDWNRNSSTVPALVFHVSPKNEPGGNCNNIRIPGASGWNWSNLPGLNITTKGCGLGADNEVRFHIDDGALLANTTYYIQSLYRDTGYNGTAVSKATGQIGLDSYATNWYGGHDFSDFHGKVCIDPDTTYAPANGVC